MATTGGAAAASGEDNNSGGKIPVPVFDCTSKTMKKFCREVATWQIGTEVTLPKQGATLSASLKGRAEEAREELDLEAIKGDDSVEVLELPALLETFVKPACIRREFEEIRDFNDRFNGIATKVKAKDIQVPDMVLADLYIEGARLPQERAASVLNGVGNKFSPTKIQGQLMINLPEVSVVDGHKEHRHDKGGYGGHRTDHKTVYATEAYDEAENDGASTDSSEGYDDDLPDELQGVIGQAEEQVAFFTKKMVHAKDKLEEAKQARGHFAKRDGGHPPKKDDAKIAKMEARTHCGARGQKGRWRGDPQRPKKNDPNARADIPRKGRHKTNRTTNDGAGDAQEPHVAEMTVAAAYQHEQLRAARDRRKVTFGNALYDIDWANMRQQANVPEEVTVTSFYINMDNQCLMAATGLALIYISVEDLLKESCGKLTFDAVCSRCVGGLDWHNDIKKKLVAINIQPIECPQKAPFRFGAPKVAHGLKAALIPCSVNGKAFTVRVSIVRSAVPGLLSRQAQSELGVVYRAGGNEQDSKSASDRGALMGLSRAGHPTLEIAGFAPGCKSVSDVSDTKTEICTRMGDLQAEVASYELDVRDAMCYQLRVILRALRAEGQDKMAQDIPGLGKMHEHELLELRRMKDIDFDQHATVPELRQRLKGWEVEGADSGASSNVAHPSSQITGGDRMRFGKYPTADNPWVLKNDLGYAQWAVLELDNSQASPPLARFGRWVKAHRAKPLAPEKARTTIEAVMAEEAVLDYESATPTAATQRASVKAAGRVTAARVRSRGASIKKGKRVGLLYQVTGLLSAFAFQAVLAADWLSQPLKPFAQYATSAAQDVADHMRNVKGVYTVRCHGVDVMQVFGGEGGVTEAAVRRNRTATEVIDRKCGSDLRKQKDLEMTHERRYASRPKSVSIELPCTYYTNITHLSFRTPQGKQVRYVRVRGLTLQDGGLIKHPAKLLVTNEKFERLRRTYSHKHYDQTFGDNVAARSSGAYPAKFCRAVVRIVEQIIRRQGGLRACQVDGGAYSSPFIATGLKQQATAYVNDAAPLGKTGEPIGGPDPMGGGDDFADSHDVKADESVDGRIGVGAILFTRKAAARCKPAELAMLKRLHFNLGHPSNKDLSRSLRLEGAKSATVQGPARLHFVQDFGDDVGFDCFEPNDVDGKSYWYFSIVDLATTFHVATLIGRHTSQEFATAFERCWASWAGVPDRVHFEMERGLGGVLSELFQSFDTVQLPIAGQAHWQLGRVERQGAWRKELAARTIEHSSIRGEDEMRRAGFSPAQWVLGRDPEMPADLVDDTANYSAHSLATNDEKIRRRYAIRTAARESFMRGEMCYILRQAKKKEQKEQHSHNAKKGIWLGPCVVIGHQGNNAWVSLGGLTMLVAPEHIKAVAELNRARDSLEQEEAPVEDIRPEPGQPEVQPDEMEQAWRELIDSPDDDDLKLNFPEDPNLQEQIEVLPADRADMPQSALEEQPYGPAEFRRRRATFDGADSGDFGPALKRLQTAKEPAGSGGPPSRAASRDRAAVSDGGAAAGSEPEGARGRSRSAPREAMQTSIVAERIKRKQADKEDHWRAIQDSDRELYREAAAKQWSEWQKYGSCQVLTIEESEAVRGRVKADLILPSRFVYRDKNAPLRTDKHPLPVKAKARLCVGGHMDPRLAQGDLRTDAPTVTRNSTMLFFTICQRFDPEIYAAGVE
ncbi:unnamed protein product, partial [Prorocentrum cordatum]